MEEPSNIQSLSSAFSSWDGHILHNAEHIRKLQADKLYIIFLCAFDDVFLCVFTHSKYSSLKK